MALILQIVTFGSIVLLALISFKLSPLQITVRKITIVTMLVVLSIVLQFFSIMVPLFGFPSLRIDFLHIPLMFIGVLFGPAWALIGGVIQDVIGLMVTPTGFPFFGFMLNKVLMGVIPGILFLKVKELDYRSINKFVYGLLAVFLIGSLAYLWTLTEIVVEGNAIAITLPIKITLSLINISLMAGLTSLIILLQRKVGSLRALLSMWTIAVLLVEVTITLVLTPTWLYAMYGIPVMLSFLVRIIKVSFMIPIVMVIGFGIMDLLMRMGLLKEHLK